jgi:hypothetical protein
VSKITNIHSSKKFGEHVLEMYVMLHKTIPHTQVYYQLNLYSADEVYERISMDLRSFSEH